MSKLKHKIQALAGFYLGMYTILFCAYLVVLPVMKYCSYFYMYMYMHLFSVILTSKIVIVHNGKEAYKA